jgi:hypothetical protein
MAKRNPAVPDQDTKWFQRGFASKYEYQGWLQFNDLQDEGYGYDDTYYDQYSGKTVRVGAEPAEVQEESDEAEKFLKQFETK